MRKKRLREERQRGSRGWRGRVCSGADTQRKTDKERQKETHRRRVHYARLCLCVCVCECVCIRCVGETAAQSLQTTMAADEACRPPDEHSDHSSKSLSQRENKEKCATDNTTVKSAAAGLIRRKTWCLLTA